MAPSFASATLAVDTSGPVGSVALARGSDPLVHRILSRRGGHAAGLIPLLDETLESVGLRPGDLTGVIVGEGPGSFTGVRVGAATVKALCRALDVPLRAVSSLAATAMVAEVAHDADDAPVRYVLFDARADRVYGACYDVRADSVRTVVDPHGGNLDAVLARALPPETVFLGDGAEKHRARLEDAGFAVLPLEAERPLAVGLIRWVGLRPDHAPVADLSTWEPEYLRVSGAERLWKA